MPAPLRPPRPVFSAAGALEYPVIALGGALGALARYSLGLGLATSSAWLPWETFGANVAGSLLVGLLVGLLRPRTPHPLLRPFLIVGVFGSFTTFSTFGLEFWQMIDADRAGAALAYAGLTPVLGVGAFMVGHHVGHRLAGTPA
jgi:CrcB protein